MSAKIYLASVLTSILILAPLTYFVLPLLYPNMKDTEENDGVGIVLQTIYEEFESSTYVGDDTDKYQLIDQTAVSITTQGDSILAILFTMQALMSISSSMVGTLKFEISLKVEGMENRTIGILYTDSTNPGTFRQIPFDISINYVTTSLIAGNYTIGVYWRSVFDLGGTNTILGYNTPHLEYPRSLWVQEMSI